jgi:hypothetical protein
MFKKIGIASTLALGVIVGLGAGLVNAATDVPSATSTLASIMGIIITTTVSLATTIFTTYWPYILVIGVIIGLIAWFKRLIAVGHK